MQSATKSISLNTKYREIVNKVSLLFEIVVEFQAQSKRLVFEMSCFRNSLFWKRLVFENVSEHQRRDEKKRKTVECHPNGAALLRRRV